LPQARSRQRRCALQDRSDEIGEAGKVARRVRARLNTVGRNQRPKRGTPGFLSSSRVFTQPVGSHLRPGELAGYYLNLSLKADMPSWPPPRLGGVGGRWRRPSANRLGPPEAESVIYAAQWGLGAYERYLAGEGEAWREAAVEAARHLEQRQERDGPQAGAWVHEYSLDHTYDVGERWVSAMAQGEAASLLVRAHAASGEDHFAEAARLAVRMLGIPLSAGGVRADLGGGFFLEEYPTDPPSHVLNGGIFALWGYHDVALGLEDADARREFDKGVDTLAKNIHRWDTGAWTRYDLFPFPIKNLASSFYHLLHIDQLRAMQLIAPRPEFEAAVARFELYRVSRARRMRAFAHKAFFRTLVPRNRLLGRRTPFRRPRKQE
jgi:heparosan-N-sulfate-glucuronate 5-epimerase